MMTFLTLASIAFPGGAIGLLFKIAIVCVIVWVVWSIGTWLLAKSGKTVPYPLVIIFWGVVAIIIIYWLFQLVQYIL
jgi:hypothetical protein